MGNIFIYGFQAFYALLIYKTEFANLCHALKNSEAVMGLQVGTDLISYCFHKNVFLHNYCVVIFLLKTHLNALELF